MTIRFNLGHDLDLEFSRSNVKFAISQPKVVRLPRNEKQTYLLNTRPQMWPIGLTLAMTLISGFSRSNKILTIWWPRSGVRIYQIVTGVTSDVGVPSTHLVLFVIWITNRYTENIIFFEHESDIGLKTQLTPHKHVGLIFLKTVWLIAKFVEKN